MRKVDPSEWSIYTALPLPAVASELSPNGAGALESLLPGDFNGDGVVDGVDLATLLAAWGG